MSPNSVLLVAALALAVSATLAAPGVPNPPHQPPAAAPAAAAPAAHDEAFFESCNQGSGWIKYRDSCYRYIEEDKYWYAALQNCTSIQGGNLVSVRDAGENSFLGKLTYCRATWIGRYAVNADRITDPTNYRWTDGTIREYHAHNVTNSPGLHHPLVSAENLQWLNNVYHAKHHFVCKVAAPTRNYTCDCPSGWKQLNNNCYHMAPFEATYIEADFYCRGRSAYVTSIHDAAELRAMSLLDVDSYGCPVETWTGLLKLNPCRVDFSTGARICYRWSDRTGANNGDYAGFPKWQSGSPNPDQVTNCVLLKDREIRSVPCHTRARFVCKKAVQPVGSRRL